MTPDQCFDEMAVALGVPKDTGYTDLLELVKELKEDKMKFAEKVMEQLVEGIKPQMDELKMKFAEKVVVEQIKPQMDKLKEENKELKKYQTMIYCVWSDLYWADKSGCEVSFKDVANSCDYYDNEEFVKQEVVEDEDED